MTATADARKLADRAEMSKWPATKRADRDATLIECATALRTLADLVDKHPAEIERAVRAEREKWAGIAERTADRQRTDPSREAEIGEITLRTFAKAIRGQP